MWQVSSTGRISGISGNVDLDAYNGTLAELKSWQGV
jgi:lysozyme